MLKTKFLNLPLYIKCIFIGTFISLGGLFLNWFRVVNEFEKLVQFNAFNGPIFLVGYTLLGLNVFSIISLLKYLKESECAFNQLKKYYIEKWSGIVICYLSVVSISFLLTGFYVNSLQKDIGIGFFVTFSGGLIVVFGSVLFKTKEVKQIANSQQLDFEFENPLTKVEMPSLNLNFKTESIIHDLICSEDASLRDQLKKQRELEKRVVKNR